uniref:CYP82BD1 n=1 Tax=Corydalis yanhusuo TaxID=458692 RepID=A0AA96NDT4_9MAGN|nr:CYP82BD1 [Corydalis yanhusuo]
MDLPLSSSSLLVFLSDQWSTISAHPLLAYVLFFCFIFYIIHLIRRPSSSKKKQRVLAEPPKVAGAWPLIGHIDLLSLPFEKFGDMVDTYGPIYRIQLGIRETVVINNSETAKECFTTHDKLFSNRPLPFNHKYGFNNDYSFNHIPHGSLWRDFRKIASVGLFSRIRIEMQRHIRTSEVNLWCNHLYMLWKKDERTRGGEKGPAVLVEISSWARNLFFFVLFDFIIGVDNGDHDQQQNGGLSLKDMGKKYKKVMDEMVHLMETTFPISDLIPFLEWYDKLTGKNTALEKKAKEMDSFLDMWLQEHRRRRHLSRTTSVIVDNNISDNQDQDGQVKSYMDIMLSTIDKDPQYVGLDTDVIIKTACQDMMFGGYQTITIALPWALFFLMNNRHVLDKARKELDEQIGKERQVEESDLKQLPYLQTILKETMRLYIPAADFLARVPSEDCEVGGFHVKAGTTVIINLRKIHQDPKIWPDSTFEFKPERFLIGSTNEGVDVKGQNFELFPFGTGRRMCPAVTFSLRLMNLVLARLIHGFELNIPMPDGTADTSVGASIPLIDRKMDHLPLLISPRLASEAYAVKH